MELPDSPLQECWGRSVIVQGDPNLDRIHIQQGGSLRSRLELFFVASVRQPQRVLPRTDVAVLVALVASHARIVPDTLQITIRSILHSSTSLKKYKALLQLGPI